MGENSKEIMENILNRINLSESKITEMEKYSQNSNETIVLNMQENLEKLEKASSDRTAELENTVMLYYQQMGANTEKIKEINSISSTLESKLQSLGKIVEETKNEYNQFEVNQNEINKGVDLQLKAECERIEKIESDMNRSVETLNKQYNDVDSKIVMIINDKFENLQAIIESYESKNKDTLQNMQDLSDRAFTIEEGMVKKFSVFDDKLLEHSNRINSLQESNNLQNQKLGNLEGLSDKVTHMEDSMKSFEENLNALMININKNDAREKKIDDSMMAIMEQANATLINDAQQDSKIKTLEIQNRSLEDKLSSLESADLFLQESYRQLTDKTVKIEADFRKSDDNLNFLYKQQHEEIEGKIRSQITDIYFEINELQQDKIGINEKLDEMENNMEKSINVVGAIEKNIPEIINKVNIDVDKKMKEIQILNEKDFSKIITDVKDENEIKNKSIGDKLNELGAGYKNLLQNMNEDKHEIENKLKSIQSESESNTQNIVSIQESIYIQSEQVKKVEAERQQAMKKDQDDVQATILGNASAIGDLKRDFDKALIEIENMNSLEKRLKTNEDDIKHLDDTIDGYRTKNLFEIEKRLKINEDQVKHIDDTIDGLNKTVSIFEGRHVETVEKMKEVTVLASNLHVQVNEKAQKMEEQSTNDIKK